MFQCFSHCTNNSYNPGAFRNGLKVFDDSFESLSAEEKERVHRDLYGVEQPTEETPEFVNAKLEELEKELGALTESVKKPYMQAKQLEQIAEEEYVSSRKFRLMFLRVEKFDAQKAAIRLVRYLKDKLDMFGSQMLSRRIKIEDLSQQDIESLTSGFFCTTNETDAAGRLVCFFRRNLFFGQDVTSMVKSMFYLFQMVVENNEQVQKKGLVIVSYNAGTQHTQWTSQIRNYMPIFRHLAHALPIRMAAVHIVYSDLKDSFLLNLIAVVFPNHLRSRLHRHYISTYEECLLLLMSLGINPNALPYTEEGVFKKELLYQYLAKLR